MPYQFNYHQTHGGDDFTSCLVPTRWLAMPLPIFGSGGVVYVDKLPEQQIDRVFEFQELAADGSERTVSLDVYSQERADGGLPSINRISHIGGPVKIHYRVLDGLAGDLSTEVVLLNHFFGTWNAESCWGNYFFDYADLLRMLRESSQFHFDFGIGEMPSDILPGILERLAVSEVESVFVTLFSDYKFRLHYLDDVIEAYSDIFEGATILVGNAAVAQDKMLISALLGFDSKRSNP
jgi:hypothetical protein